VSEFVAFTKGFGNKGIVTASRHDVQSACLYQSILTEAGRRNVTALKKAFELARLNNNIEIVFDVFLNANLFVVGKNIPFHDDPVLYVKLSPIPKRLCVTASESTDIFEGMYDIDIIEITGRNLLNRMVKSHEIVIIYRDGGDYLTTEHLDWLRNRYKI